MALAPTAGLNCRIDDGTDITPYHKTTPRQSKKFTNIEKAFLIIPEDEYEFIYTINDIYLPEIPLTTEEKQLLLDKI